MILAWVLLFSLYGFLRGTIAQVFGLIGIFVGLWAALLVARWLEGHWVGSEPALVYMAFRWIVAALAGFGAASLFQWWGESLGRSVRSSPAAWWDRGGGFALGALAGLGTVAFVLMLVLLTPRPRRFADTVARARTTAPLMSSAAHACSLSARYLPGGTWLESGFRTARGRAETARTAQAPRRAS